MGSGQGQGRVRVRLRERVPSSLGRNGDGSVHPPGCSPLPDCLLVRLTTTTSIRDNRPAVLVVGHVEVCVFMVTVFWGVFLSKNVNKGAVGIGLGVRVRGQGQCQDQGLGYKKWTGSHHQHFQWQHLDPFYYRCITVIFALQSPLVWIIKPEFVRSQTQTRPSKHAPETRMTQTTFISLTCIVCVTQMFPLRPQRCACSVRTDESMDVLLASCRKKTNKLRIFPALEYYAVSVCL